MKLVVYNGPGPVADIKTPEGVVRCEINVPIEVPSAIANALAQTSSFSLVQSKEPAPVEFPPNEEEVYSPDAPHVEGGSLDVDDR